MTALARNAGQSGAETVVTGTIPIYATWTEDIYFFDPDGAAMDISDLDFQFQFRCSGTNTGADVTLSITGGELSIVDDGGSIPSILRINANPGTFSSYVGDMIADLVAIDASDNVTLYAHGVVAFTNNPVAI